MNEFESDKKIKAFFDADKAASPDEDITQQRNRAIARSRANIAQRDTILFAFVKLWTTIAEILAPIFAALAVKQANNRQQHYSNKQSNKD
ncbi:MAG: hypothetical protein ACRBCI_15825 [Cellvibrionaceae bacterium]